MKTFIKYISVIVFCFTLCSVVAKADFDSGVAAFDNKEYKVAFKELMLVAEQGNHSAQIRIGSMYFEGQGVAQNYVLAHMWFNISRANGNENASYWRGQAASKLTPELIYRSQLMAGEWMEKHQ